MRLTTVLLALVMGALVAALVVGTHLSRVNARTNARASAEHDVAISTWPRSFVRVPNASTSCSVNPPAVCLHSEESTDKVSAKVAATLGTSTLKRTAVVSAPDTYIVNGTIGNDRTAVVVTITPHPAPAAKPQAARKYVGSDMTVELAPAV